jgi:RNA polymerase sigma-70 factor (ECF subfamily)
MQDATHTIENTVDGIQYDELFKNNSRIIFKFIYCFSTKKHLNLNRDDVNDIYQEIALKLVKNDYLSKYDNEKSSFFTWLNIICRTTTIDYYRKKMRWETGEWFEEPAAHVEPETGSAEFSLPVGVLTDRQEQVITMYFKGDLEAAEIANRLGISPMTVRSIKFQAIERLRKYFGSTAHAAPRTPAPGNVATETRRKVS